VYALYQHYKFSIAQIGQLFIVGFGSSMLFGTFVGGLADRYGRKLNCLIFTVLYGISCVTKHSPSFEVLMVGRLLGGVATSILMSAFETWMIHEHKTVCCVRDCAGCSACLQKACCCADTLVHWQAGYPEDWLSETFSLMTFGSGVVAIVAGIVSSGVRLPLLTSLCGPLR
jgi:MFS transporter, MFS domain-containing protein family, molybdate-anion transporter